MYPASAESVLWLTDPGTELSYQRLGLDRSMVEKIQQWEYAHYDLAEATATDLTPEQRTTELTELDTQGLRIGQQMADLFGPGVVLRLRTSDGEVDLKASRAPKDTAVADKLRRLVERRRTDWAAMMGKLQSRVEKSAPDSDS